MSTQHIKQLIKDSYSPIDLIEKLEPWVTVEDLMDRLEDIIDNNFHEIFEEELEKYYNV